MDVAELEPAEALQRQRLGALLVDVREAHERALGMAEGARGIALGELVEAPASLLDANADILLICQSGKRSMRAAQALLEAGFARVASVRGGTERWRAEGLPMREPQPRR